RDEPDLGSFGQLVNPYFREFRNRVDPHPKTRPPESMLLALTSIRTFSPLSEEVVAPSAFSGGVDGRVISLGS
ncbi:MAG TPA: hypothetical protein VFF61_08980, partial [Microvirga sp.]|nr:hypothetical protein [Microvirga sp.]